VASSRKITLFYKFVSEKLRTPGKEANVARTSEAAMSYPNGTRREQRFFCDLSEPRRGKGRGKRQGIPERSVGGKEQTVKKRGEANKVWPCLQQGTRGSGVEGLTGKNGLQGGRMGVGGGKRVNWKKTPFQRVNINFKN